MYSEIALTAISIFLQVLWIVFMTYQFTIFSKVFNHIFNIIAVVLALYVVNQAGRPYAKLSWIFLILCFPIAGCPCYFLFGRRGLTKKNQQNLQTRIDALQPFRVEDPLVKEELKQNDIDAWKQSEYITNYAGYPLCREEDSKYFSSGEEMLPAMLADIEKAQHYVFLEYFIMSEGHMLEAVLKALEKKAAEGVLVRLIYDDFGCKDNVPKHFFEHLRARGIQCECFHPVRPILAVIMNNRDHRKITVIDGRIAYTGGINLADEYINEYERFGYWKDAAIRVTGDAAWSFVTMFLETWGYIRKEREDYSRFLPQNLSKNGSDAANSRPEHFEECSGFVQPYADSPLDHEDVGETVYLNLISNAKKYVYIYTPYLIVSSEMITALVNAAKCGVDVRIILPGIPDKKLVFMLTRSYYEQLIAGGVKVYEFAPGFLHSKCFVVDDAYAVVGSINLDYRSFYLHFECATFLYRAKAVLQVKEDVLETLKQCRRIDRPQEKKWNLPHQLWMSILHLFAPLL